ncbi:MAG TPA: ATPase domain-containing protein [Nitrososphaerales archaeon]|nr:ATPase domain-containing protein [Nitrososphaerales archaeon]
MPSSGVYSLDKILAGGYPQRSSVLIEGLSGGEKESLAYQFIRSGLDDGDFCLFATRLLPEDVASDAKASGIDLDKGTYWMCPEKGDRDYVLGDLASISFGIKSVLKEHESKGIRIAFDLPSQLLMDNTSDSVFRFLSQLLADLKRHNATLVAIVQEDMHPPQVLAGLELLFDGVLAVKRSAEAEVEIRIKKMRGIRPAASTLLVPIGVEARNGASSLGSQVKRVAVLPFANMSPDPDDEYLADGMTEEIIDKLSQIKEIEVIARTSVMTYKNRERKAAEIGRELSVVSLIEGSVRKAGNRIRVTAQLINTDTEVHLWSSHYDKDMDDIFAVESDIAERVASELKIRLLDSEKHTIEKKATGDTVAYTYYLRGMQLARVGLGEEPLRQALSLFEDAVARDPKFARGYVGIAECYQGMANRGYIPYYEGLEKGRASALKALEMDPDLAEAHVRLSGIMLNVDENQKGTNELKEALELNPNLADAHAWVAIMAANLGDKEEMVRAAEKAYKLDPLAVGTITWLGWAYFWSGREREATEHWRKTRQLEPYVTYRSMFDYYVCKGDYKEAEKMVKEQERISPTVPSTYCNRGILAALTGDTKTAHEMITKLDKGEGWGTTSFAGFIYFALGDLGKFFDYQFRAAEDHTLFVSLLRCSPLYENARKDLRFGELLRKAGLPYESHN